MLEEDHIVKAINREGKIFLITSDEDTAVVEVLPQLTVTILILERSYTHGLDTFTVLISWIHVERFSSFANSTMDSQEKLKL